MHTAHYDHEGQPPHIYKKGARDVRGHFIGQPKKDSFLAVEELAGNIRSIQQKAHLSNLDMRLRMQCLKLLSTYGALREASGTNHFGTIIRPDKMARAARDHLADRCPELGYGSPYMSYDTETVQAEQFFRRNLRCRESQAAMAGVLLQHYVNYASQQVAEAMVSDLQLHPQGDVDAFLQGLRIELGPSLMAQREAIRCVGGKVLSLPEMHQMLEGGMQELDALILAEAELFYQKESEQAKSPSR